MNSALGQAWSRIHKSLNFINSFKVIGDGGHSISAFYSVKLCVTINFSFSFGVVLYSMYSVYATVLLDERGCYL